AVTVERDALAEVALAADLGLLAPDHLQSVELAAAILVQEQLRPGHGRAGGTAFAGLAVADVDQLVVGKAWMQHHVAQATLAAMGHLGHAGDRADLAACRVEQAQAARHLGHQQAAIRKEGHGPGGLEALHFDDLERRRGPERWRRRRSPAAWPARGKARWVSWCLLADGSVPATVAAGALAGCQSRSWDRSVRARAPGCGLRPYPGYVADRPAPDRRRERRAINRGVRRTAPRRRPG